tara:strand:- start:820 stop:1215 length:396 start_codon:yes stop_codon:yes gene_type:complete
MEESFKLEIISPEKIIFSEKTKMVTIPSYEGDMSLLKNHISIITFLRPGILKVEKNDGSFEEFFAEDGTIEYFNDALVVLSSSVVNVKNMSKNLIEELSKNAENQLTNKDISDHERYILNHKLSTLKEISV